MSETTIHFVGLMAAAILPGLILLTLLNSVALDFSKGVRWRFGRPWAVVFLAFATGVLAAWPACWLEGALQKAPWRLDSVGGLFLFWLIVAGLVEEGCKFAAFQLGPARTRWFLEEYDGVLCAAGVGLGFATIENMQYVREAGLEVAKMRAFTAVPAHAMFGIIMGAYLGMARARARIRWSDMGLPLTGLMIAILVHGLYDLFATMSSVTGYVGLAIVMLTLAGASFRICGNARRRSPAFGGACVTVLPHGSLRLPPGPVSRNPWVAGALGLIPGLGQAYNGEALKSAVFLFIGVVNLTLFWLAHLFVSDPGGALELLRKLGFHVVVQPHELAQAVQQKWLLEPMLLYLVLIWEVVGAVEAWVTARKPPLRPQISAVRQSFASHGFGTSYAVHLMAIFMLVVAPLVDCATGGRFLGGQTQTGTGEACGGDGKGSDSGGSENVGLPGEREWQLTWVKAPTHIEGWQDTAQGTGDASATQAGVKSPDLEEDPDGSLTASSPSDDEPAGEPGGSYNQYLSYQIRRHQADRYFFHHVRPRSWAIVHYRIGYDGTLQSVELVKYEGTLEEGERAVGVVRRAAPFQPLPGSARALDVIELFWTLDTRDFAAGSLEWKLSQVPDGRLVKEIRD